MAGLPPSAQVPVLIADLEAAKSSFHARVDTLPQSGWKKTSANPPWTNGQVLFHITLAFILMPFLVPLARTFGRLPPIFSRAFAAILDVGTGPFNWANRLGPTAASPIYNRERLLRKYDALHAYAMRALSNLDPTELHRGMFYPRKWDPMFRGYMTVTTSSGIPPCT